MTLSGRVAPLPRAWAVAAGCALVLAGVSVAALLVAAGTGGSSSPSHAGAIVKLAAAALLVPLGVHTLRAPPRPPRADADADPTQHARLGRAFAIGAGMMAVNFTSLVLYFPAVHEIGISHVAFDDKALAFAALFLIALTPALVPPLVVTLMGDRATPALERLNAFFTTHRRGIGASICFVFAVLLAFAGLRVLL